MHKHEVRPKTTDHTGMECINTRYSPKLLIKWKSFGQFWMHLFQIKAFPQGTLLLQWCKHLSQPENALQYSSLGIFNSGFTPLETPWTEKTFSLPAHLSREERSGSWRCKVRTVWCLVQDLDFCPSRHTVMALVLWGLVVEDNVVLGGGDWTLTANILWAKLFLNNVARWWSC